MDKKTLVKINQTTYSIVQPPKSSSPIVMEERLKIVQKMELKTLVEDLCNVGSFVRLAYNSLIAAGPQFTDMQLAVRDLGYDVTRLCDKSAEYKPLILNACSKLCQAVPGSSTS